jgi:hypothetical protein
MNRGSVDPWAGEQMNRSDAQRRYNNLVQYQLRPMLLDRRLSNEERVSILKRIVNTAGRFRYESGVVAGGGTREEVLELCLEWLKPEHAGNDEVKDWIKRTIRAFGASIATDE